MGKDIKTMWFVAALIVYIIGGFFAWAHLWRYVLGHNDSGICGMLGFLIHVLATMILITVVWAIAAWQKAAKEEG